MGKEVGGRGTGYWRLVAPSDLFLGCSRQSSSPISSYRYFQCCHRPPKSKQRRAALEDISGGSKTSRSFQKEAMFPQVRTQPIGSAPDTIAAHCHCHWNRSIPNKEECPTSSFPDGLWTTSLEITALAKCFWYPKCVENHHLPHLKTIKTITQPIVLNFPSQNLLHTAQSWPYVMSSKFYLVSRLAYII